MSSITFPSKDLAFELSGENQLSPKRPKARSGGRPGPRVRYTITEATFLGCLPPHISATGPWGVVGEEFFLEDSLKQPFFSGLPAPRRMNHILQVRCEFLSV